MTPDVSLQNLKVDKRDPRQNPIFLELSWCMQNADSRRFSEDEWKTLDTQCRTYWRKNGYDLQSGCWFCLLSLKLHGWKGLEPALDILLRFWSSEYCWPPVTDPERRRYLLEWFNTHVVTDIYQLDSDGDFSAVAGNIAKNIALLHEEAVKTDARCKQSLKNLNFFLQVRNRSLASQVIKPSYAETRKDSLPESLVVRNKVNLSVRSGSLKRKHLFLAGGVGILCGMVVAIMLMGALKYTDKSVITRQLVGFLADFQRDDALTAAAWQRMKKGELESHHDEILRQSASLLRWIADRPADELLRKGTLLAQRLEETWPGNPVSQGWKHDMRAKADNLPSAQSYEEITADLDKFDAKLASTEQKKGGYLTVSELKSFSWKIRRELEKGGIPPAELIRYSAKKEEPERSENLKSAADSLSALNALYLLSLKQSDLTSPGQE